MGVRNLHITSFTFFNSEAVKVNGARLNVTLELVFLIGQASFNQPINYKSSLIARESLDPIRWSNIDDATFLKMCIGSNKWLTFKSHQYGNRKK